MEFRLIFIILYIVIVKPYGTISYTWNTFICLLDVNCVDTSTIIIKYYKTLISSNSTTALFHLTRY